MSDDASRDVTNPAYEPPKILATYDAGDILAHAETSSVVIIVS